MSDSLDADAGSSSNQSTPEQTSWLSSFLGGGSSQQSSFTDGVGAAWDKVSAKASDLYHETGEKLSKLAGEFDLTRKQETGPISVPYKEDPAVQGQVERMEEAEENDKWKRYCEAENERMREQQKYEEQQKKLADFDYERGVYKN